MNKTTVQNRHVYTVVVKYHSVSLVSVFSQVSFSNFTKPHYCTLAKNTSHIISGMCGEKINLGFKKYILSFAFEYKKKT